MPKPPRHDEPGELYHLYNQGARGNDNYETTLDRRFFLARFADEAPEHGIELLAYCLMNNHFHALVRSSSGQLSDFMRDATSVYVRGFNAWNDYSGPLWRSRFQSKHVASAPYARYLSLYIHRNPKDLGWADALERYPWSSLAHYLKPATAPPWLDVSPILEQFGGPDAYARRIARFRPAGSVPEADPGAVAASWAVRRLDQVLQAVGYASGVDPAMLRRSIRGHRDPRRCVAILLAAELVELPMCELAHAFGLGSGRAFGQAARRARLLVASDVAMAAWHEQARSILGS